MMRDDETAARIFRELLRQAGAEERSCAAEPLRLAGRVSEWRRNQPCGSTISGGRIGCVLSGAVRKYSIRSNGHRQIVDLFVAGDFLGLASTGSSFSLEAVSNETRIASFRAGQIQALCDTFPVIANLIRERAADAIKRLENHLLVQGRTTAIEKVGGYLMLMCGRLAGAEDEALLPVSRYDIADHLGLAVETVSRTMTALSRSGVIAMTSPRHVEIRKPATLADGLA
jgi:CRP-like cAMP-binding protein